jgi:hypothetical protein
MGACWSRRTVMRGCSCGANHHALDLVEGHLFAAAVIKLCPACEAVFNGCSYMH